MVHMGSADSAFVRCKLREAGKTASHQVIGPLGSACDIQGPEKGRRARNDDAELGECNKVFRGVDVHKGGREDAAAT